MEIIRWQGNEPATETEVKALVRQSGLAAWRWEGEPGKHYPPHHHPHTKTLWVARGAITFYINSETLNLEAGDKMILPANTRHEADAGPEGVVCFEAPPVHDNPSIKES